MPLPRTFCRASALLTVTFLIFSLQSEVAFAQFSFTQLHTDTASRAYGGKVCTTADNGSLLSMGGGTFTLVKVNQNGNVQWTKSYGGFSQASDYYPALQPLADGSVLVANSWHVMRIDALGDELWAKSYKGPQTNGQNIRAICPINTNEFWLLPASGPWKESLIKIDLNGDTLQTVTWQEPFDGRNLIPLSDGNFLLSSSYALVKVDAQGQVLWHKEYGVNQGFVFGKVHELANGNLVVATGVWTGAINLSFGMMELDATGNVILAKLYGSLTNEDFNGWATDLMPLNDGGYVVVGAMGDADPTDYDHDAFLMRTDSLGDTLWTRRYHRTELFSEFHQLVSTSNQQLVASGFVFDLSTNTNEQLLLRFDSTGAGLDGCFTPNTPMEIADVTAQVLVSNGTLTVSSAVVYVTDLTLNTSNYNGLSSQLECSVGEPLGTAELNRSTLTVFPNPTHGSLHFQLDDAASPEPWQILNSVGQPVAQGSSSTSTKSDVSSLPSGLYILRLGAQQARFIVR